MGKILDTGRGTGRARTAVLVLGAAVWADGPSPTLRRRCRTAAELWQSGVAANVIVSGGLGRFAPSEAQMMQTLLCHDDVPPEAIAQEDRATTTHENLLFSLPILARLGATHVILVTDLTHGPRALLTARSLGLNATVKSPPLRGARKRTLVYQALREAIALPAYAIRLRGSRKH